MATFKEYIKANNILPFENPTDKNNIEVDEDMIYNLLSGLFSNEESTFKFNLELINTINWCSSHNLLNIDYLIKAFGIFKTSKEYRTGISRDQLHMNFDITFDYDENINSFIVKEIKLI